MKGRTQARWVAGIASTTQVRRVAGIVLTLLVASGCASTGGSQRDGPILPAELRELGSTSIYDAVRILRPTWLPRLAGAYRDDVELTNRELQTMMLRGTETIEIISASDATARWGTRLLSGRFLVITSRE